MKTNQKINQLRVLMKENKIHMYIIQCNDPHQSEYAPEHWRDRAFMSGFTGSVGTLVVTEDQSFLWADGRYHLQAAKEIQGSEIQLFKQGLEGVLNYDVWVGKNIESGQTIGYFNESFSYGQKMNIVNLLKDKEVNFYDKKDLVGLIWKTRPEKVFKPILEHGPVYAGQSVFEKLTMVRKKMTEKNVEIFILSNCDDLAWLYNIRGRDVPNNPFVNSYSIITFDHAYLYLNEEGLTKHNLKTLIENGVDIKSYEKIFEDISLMTKAKKVYLQGAKTSVKIVAALACDAKLDEGINFTTPLKAIKHKTEIDHLLNCHKKDGVAMVSFLSWLETEMKVSTLTEISASDQLEAFRKDQDGFQQLSFDTIAGYKDHGAMMHYKATEKETYTLENEGLFLVDSGGQYLDGTTDITRTMVMGKITQEEKEDYTLTLKGLIALSKTKFLYGATGSNLDILARQALWERGLDYKCGTGHGVGFFLGVHEGPQSISQVPNKVVLEENMIITIEPGVYRAGSHGVRLENIVVVEKNEKTEFGQFMTFKSLTLCPFEIEAIEVDLLSAAEVSWFNAYQQEVYDTLAPELSDELKSWLKEKTKAI